jgi:hypothetical protein
MAVQKKLFRLHLNREFWQNLKRSSSFLVRDLLVGRDVARLAARLREEGVSCSDSLLYKWANPNDVQIPNLEQFFLLIKHTENCEPFIEVGRACGYIAVPVDDLAGALDVLLAAYRAGRGEVP